MRTIEEAHRFIKECDSETSLTKHALRVLSKQGIIPSVMVGNRTLIDIDALTHTLSMGAKAETNANSYDLLN